MPDASEYIYVTYTNASGTETVLSSSQYSITINSVATGQIWASGFTLTYPTSGAPIANGTSLTVQRILPLQQLTSLENQGNFYPQAVEAGLDVLEMQIQQVSARGGSYRGVWATNVIYNFGDIVQDGVNGAYTNNIYVCAIANTSGTWATDLASGDWSLALNIQTINASGTYLPLAGGTISGNLAVTGGVSAPYLGLGVADAVTGSTNAIILTVSSTPATLLAGQIFQFQPIYANTGATTLTVEPLGATKNVYKQSTTGPTALQGGEFQIGQMALVAYDGTEFQLISTSSTAVSGGGYIASTNVQKFTSSGTYTPSAGMVQAVIECWGGGGGGAGIGATTGGMNGASGGGSGGYSRTVATSSTIGSSQTVTIGAAGAGGSTGANNGGAGGNTSVGSLCIANGGSGGTVASFGSAGGAGGTAGTGSVIPGTGSPGGSTDGSASTSVVAFGGFGGSTSVGGGGAGPNQQTSGANPGVAGTGYGAGGSGAAGFNSSSTAAGGAGTAGLVIITELINTATGTGSTTALTASSINGGQLAGLRNRTINGDMRIDQRNAGASQTITAGTSNLTNAYTVDRFYAACTGANVTGQRVTGTSPDQYAYQFTGASSVTAIAFGQRYEATNVYDLASTTATFSVRLANSLLTTVTWTAYYPGSADTWSSRTSIATGTFTVSSTPAKYSVQISLPSNVTTGLEIELTVGAQISGTWTIAEWQLENGSTATPFERRPVGLELELSQRYYQIGYFAQNGWVGAGSVSTSFFEPFIVSLRVQPTITTSNASVSNFNSISYTPNIYGLTVAGTSTTSGYAISLNYQASAEL